METRGPQGGSEKDTADGTAAETVAGLTLSEADLELALREMEPPVDERAWLRGKMGEVPDAQKDLAEKAAAPASTMLSAIWSVRQMHDANGGDIGEALENHRDGIEYTHERYMDRVRGAAEMGIPEHMYREGIDPNTGKDEGFLRGIGALD